MVSIRPLLGTPGQPLWKSAFCLIKPASQQVRVEPMFQRDGGDGYAGCLASGDHPHLEFLGVAPATSTRRQRFFFDSVHVSAYSL
jgi:hypothetical protein